MIPSYGKSLSKDPVLLEETRAYTSEVLGLNEVPSINPVAG
jgi:malate dehydrogenase (quinone)